jgi:hypothetical protein
MIFYIHSCKRKLKKKIIRPPDMEVQKLKKQFSNFCKDGEHRPQFRQPTKNGKRFFRIFVLEDNCIFNYYLRKKKISKGDHFSSKYGGSKTEEYISQSPRGR